ncbi:hypothetical protein EDEG_01557 [Edhazardia aedis USNM 41457]|uniref:SCP domain-containing protein n=1 Tax=Edhazardia aedis (strain USNM 41457) TaxID=1003232 RepID=J8ZWW0_EDHAE|nr:hypothetical protein EDEG_01557 [Edhazardia aedis USNM 41457]|eukprot:EJW04153.1 hypothetical protein EDEG_01557 [Edhazardia aedis USNM 41457]
MLLYRIILIYITNVCCDLEEELLDLINTYRVHKNYPILHEISALKNAARDHADYLCKIRKLTHKGAFYSKMLDDRLRNNDYVGEEIGENIAKENGDDYEEVFRVWKTSDEHKKNLLGDYNGIGVGTCKNNFNERFWVVVFGKKEDKKIHDLYHTLNDTKKIKKDISTGFLNSKHPHIYNDHINGYPLGLNYSGDSNMFPLKSEINRNDPEVKKIQKTNVEMLDDIFYSSPNILLDENKNPNQMGSYENDNKKIKNKKIDDLDDEDSKIVVILKKSLDNEKSSDKLDGKKITLNDLLENISGKNETVSKFPENNYPERKDVNVEDSNASKYTSTIYVTLKKDAFNSAVETTTSLKKMSKEEKNEYRKIEENTEDIKNKDASFSTDTSTNQLSTSYSIHSSLLASSINTDKVSSNISVDTNTLTSLNSTKSLNFSKITEKLVEMYEKDPERIKNIAFKKLKNSKAKEKHEKNLDSPPTRGSSLLYFTLDHKNQTCEKDEPELNAIQPTITLISEEKLYSKDVPSISTLRVITSALNNDSNGYNKLPSKNIYNDLENTIKTQDIWLVLSDKFEKLKNDLLSTLQSSLGIGNKLQTESQFHQISIPTEFPITHSKNNEISIDKKDLSEFFSLPSNKFEFVQSIFNQNQTFSSKFSSISSSYLSENNGNSAFIPTTKTHTHPAFNYPTDILKYTDDSNKTNIIVNDIKTTNTSDYTAKNLLTEGSENKRTIEFLKNRGLSQKIETVTVTKSIFTDNLKDSQPETLTKITPFKSLDDISDNLDHNEKTETSNQKLNDKDITLEQENIIKTTTTKNEINSNDDSVFEAKDSKIDENIATDTHETTVKPTIMLDTSSKKVKNSENNTTQEYESAKSNINNENIKTKTVTLTEINHKTINSTIDTDITRTSNNENTKNLPQILYPNSFTESVNNILSNLKSKKDNHKLTSVLTTSTVQTTVTIYSTLLLNNDNSTEKNTINHQEEKPNEKNSDLSKLDPQHNIPYIDSRIEKNDEKKIVKFVVNDNILKNKIDERFYANEPIQENRDNININLPKNIGTAFTIQETYTDPIITKKIDIIYAYSTDKNINDLTNINHTQNSSQNPKTEYNINHNVSKNNDINNDDSLYIKNKSEIKSDINPKDILNSKDDLSEDEIEDALNRLRELLRGRSGNKALKILLDDDTKQKNSRYTNLEDAFNQ